MRRTLKGILGLAAVFSLTVAGGRYTFAQTGAQSEKTSSGIVIETRAADKDNESEKAAETAKNIESGKAADVAKRQNQERLRILRRPQKLRKIKNPKIQQMSVRIRSLLKIKMKMNMDTVRKFLRIMRYLKALRSMEWSLAA